jgi:hypothetical protein
MRTFDSGAGESVMEWCLGPSSVRQKSPIEVQHAQKATELTGGLRRGAALKMGHSFLQWSGSLRKHPVTEVTSVALKTHFAGLIGSRMSEAAEESP